MRTAKLPCKFHKHFGLKCSKCQYWTDLQTAWDAAPKIHSTSSDSEYRFVTPMWSQEEVSS